MQWTILVSSGPLGPDTVQRFCVDRHVLIQANNISISIPTNGDCLDRQTLEWQQAMIIW